MGTGIYGPIGSMVPAVLREPEPERLRAYWREIFASSEL